MCICISSKSSINQEPKNKIAFERHTWNMNITPVHENLATQILSSEIAYNSFVQIISS